MQIKTGKCQEAYETFKRCQSLYPGYDNAEIKKSLSLSRECSKEIKSANSSITKKNYKEAISTLEKLLATAKNSITLRLSLARVLFETKKWEKLSDECVTILKLQPDNLEALYMRGYALLENGDIDAANAHFKKVRFFWLPVDL